MPAIRMGAAITILRKVMQGYKSDQPQRSDRMQPAPMARPREKLQGYPVPIRCRAQIVLGTALTFPLFL